MSLIKLLRESRYNMDGSYKDDVRPKQRKATMDVIKGSRKIPSKIIKSNSFDSFITNNVEAKLDDNNIERNDIQLKQYKFA